MSRRRFINFPASDFMTDFEIIHISRENIRRNNAIRGVEEPIEPAQELQVDNSEVVNPHPNTPQPSTYATISAAKLVRIFLKKSGVRTKLEDEERIPKLKELLEVTGDEQSHISPHSDDDSWEDTDQSLEIQLPDIKEDTPAVNVRHISINIDSDIWKDIPENQILDISDQDVFETQDHHLETNSQENLEVEDNKEDSSDTLKDSNSSGSKTDTSNTSFRSAIDSPSTSSSPTTPTVKNSKFDIDEIEHLQKIVHTTMKIRNNDALFVNILNIANKSGPIISAVSPNFSASYINDYFVCHICHSQDKNPSVIQISNDTHPCIKTVAGMFVHLHKEHCQKIGNDRQLSFAAEKFIEEQVTRLQFDYPTPIFDTESSIPKSASTSIMDNTWVSNGLDPQQTLRPQIKHIFDNTSCHGHSVIEIPKEAEFYDLAISIYCKCENSLDKTITKVVSVSPRKSPSFAKSFQNTHKTLLELPAVKNMIPAKIPKPSFKTHPIGKPKTRADTRKSDDSQKSPPKK